MADITAIIAYLDKYLEESGNTAVTAVKANELLADQGLLRDSEHRPGLPLRNLLREDLIPHAYQIPKKKYGKWYIPKSRGRKIGQGETSSEKKGGKVGVLTPQNDGPTRVPNPKIEVIRRKYKPAKIKILFIGESPPAGGTFFYDGNSNLAKYTKSAFENCFGTSISQMPEFLRFFKEQGCFLDDLCLYPINNIKDKYHFGNLCFANNLSKLFRLQLILQPNVHSVPTPYHLPFWQHLVDNHISSIPF